MSGNSQVPSCLDASEVRPPSYLRRPPSRDLQRLTVGRLSKGGWVSVPPLHREPEGGSTRKHYAVHTVRDEQ